MLENKIDDPVSEEGCGDFVESESIAMDSVQGSKTASTRSRRNDDKNKKRSKDKSNGSSPWICRICDKEFSGEFGNIQI